MGIEKNLAEAAVAAYGQPHFPQAMQELHTIAGNPHRVWHYLGEAGMKETMLGHAKELRSRGQPKLARNVLIEAKIRFGNGSRPD